MPALLACIAFALLSFAAASGAQTVRGTATTVQRIALPPNAIFEARVEDVSRADAAATVIGSVRIESPGNPPIAFAIEVDPAAIDARRHYSVRASISVDGKLRMTSDRAYPVLTRGHGNEVAVLLRPAGGLRPGLVGGAARSPLGPLPASYAGDLPCADCPALRYRLNLFADHSYFLATEYVGRKDSLAYDIGHWSLMTDNRTLALRGARAEPEAFRVVDAKSLRKLDRNGRDIDSALNYTLMRLAPLETIEPRLAMRGMYRYMADAATFTECLTGQRWPVAMQGDSVTLEREYLKARSAPGAELLVGIDGEVKQLPRVEGSGTRPTLIVHRYTGAWPGQTCGPQGKAAALLEMHWVLIDLNGRPASVPVRANRREPSLVLHTDKQRVSGSGGCNRFSGSYELDGNALSFGQMASTMMACIDSMELEKEFLDALAAVKSWRIASQHLELLDAGGAVLVRLQSRPLR